MKKLTILFSGIFFLTACGSDASPEGRAKTRDEALQLQIDSLKNHQHALSDSIHVINQKLERLGSGK